MSTRKTDFYTVINRKAYWSAIDRNDYVSYTFFVDSTTRMNSHLTFGQIIPEPRVTSGGSERLVELNWFASFERYLPLFPNLTADQRTTYQGVVACAALQLTTFGLFLDDMVGAKFVLNRDFWLAPTSTKSMPRGAQLLELKRTNSFNYPAENPGILYTMATLGGQVTGVNM
ncbi:hypothetical protein IWQ60_006514 [Tieghemiomyces parasiticus]|uniref:Alginate lyase domain-containing protein n=1 Tax=Tieghemiomyces parasiticus TaxID=78921 RepID=A0A9W8AAA8_9FUNG|nr:hypothetical protein IWQ60_006514 [Tieghemiomyces parasiticus]